MGGRLQAADLAARAGCEEERLHELARIGILRPGPDGRFPLADVHLVGLAAALEGAGIDLRHVAAGMASGDISFADFGYLGGPPPGAALTAEEVAAELGRPPDLVRRVLAAAGLPPGEGPLRDDDAALVAGLVDTFDLAADDELERLARLYGESGRRLAQGARRFYDRTVQRPVVAGPLPQEEKQALLRAKAEQAVATVGRLVEWAHRRHLEHEILDYVTESVEVFLEERGVARARAARPPAIAFLDLSGFTALTEERGDETAAELAARLAAVVQSSARARDGEAVKWLGDGVMFHFADPTGAVAGALDLVERTTREVDVPARIGVNAGPVVFQDGDYFGRTVNVAARIADYARPQEVLVSQDVVDAGAHEGVVFDRVGDIPLKGLSTPVTLHRALPR